LCLDASQSYPASQRAGFRDIGRTRDDAGASAVTEEEPMRFDGTGALVTGAGHGIGRATAMRLADDGAAVLCFDMNGERADETVGMIEKRGGSAVAGFGDVRDRSSIEAALGRALERFGGHPIPRQ
jgi:FlaA1/EpsC-like NDP-sugar epimerase